MEHPNENEGEVEFGQFPSKEEVDEGKDAHNYASNSVASLSPDPIDHIGDPGATEDGGEDEGTHDNPYVRLGASMTRNEEGEEEEGAKTRYGKQVGKGHGDK